MYSLVWQTNDDKFSIECGIYESWAEAWFSMLFDYAPVKAEAERRGRKWTEGAFKLSKVPDAWMYAGEKK